MVVVWSTRIHGDARVEESGGEEMRGSALVKNNSCRSVPPPPHRR
jgi:hypothetical protein